MQLPGMQPVLLIYAVVVVPSLQIWAKLLPDAFRPAKAFCSGASTNYSCHE